MPEANRDDLYIDQTLADLAWNATGRLARGLMVDDDAVLKKEIYRAIMQVAVDFTLMRDRKE